MSGTPQHWGSPQRRNAPSMCFHEWFGSHPPPRPINPKLLLLYDFPGLSNVLSHYLNSDFFSPFIKVSKGLELKATFLVSPAERP